MTDSESPDAGDGNKPAASGGALYPALRQLPRLAVPYADLYRRVRVQEVVYEMLTQQFETARIQEAKDVPVLSVIDPPGLPEKKSFPPRLLVTLLLTTVAISSIAGFLLFRARWNELSATDPRRILAKEMVQSLQNRIPLRRSSPTADAHSDVTLPSATTRPTP